MRNGNHVSPTPLISQLKIVGDLQAGMTQARISRDYDCTLRMIYTILHKGAQWSGPLPSGFELLVGNASRACA